MKGQMVGYVRVSSADQFEDRQLVGIALDRKFADRISGKNTDRVELQNMLAYVRHGDTVVVHSLDRLARNLPDLLQLVKTMTNKGVTVKFIKENLEFSGDDSPMSILLLSVLGAFAQFERELIRERQREGIALAKLRGVYKGRKPALTKAQAEELRQRASAGESKAELARVFHISRDTVYKYLNGKYEPRS
ncbi:recombinase family protein [Alicyclobacillus tolerans]|uniref:recombinase family protein n=1 Tax=Alicyclobacillus tolerans TaxID=90970 RepID=UPI001F39ACF6|nr:recombinase family protein [Alicyclobacillus tolerans]MCF8564994.1 recombinase family protein [Alicyclobacillus tolerans]